MDCNRGSTCPNCESLGGRSCGVRLMTYLELLHIDRGFDDRDMLGKVGIEAVDVETRANFAVLSTNLRLA